ncbi:hypothetical protein U0070_011187 [Myodes glareolus]|uniref:Uncharacterized protein n=1 Tax=Myodes glareolus TaxID=447135 RepID=A0AAW0HI54_MYOGA
MWEEVVTSHRESSYQHDILLEVHLPVSVFIQFLHYLVHSICILLDLWKEKMEIYTTKLEPAQWLRGRNEQLVFVPLLARMGMEHVDEGLHGSLQLRAHFSSAPTQHYNDRSEL